MDYYEYCRKIRRLEEKNGINKSLKFLLLDFADRHGKNGIICPCNATIAEDNCISENSIDGLLSRARKNKLIKTSPARKGKPRYITLLCPESGDELFLQICKKEDIAPKKTLQICKENSNNFANTQKRTYYINDKVFNDKKGPPSSIHLPTRWSAFLFYSQKKWPEKFSEFLEMPENRYLSCPEFIEYLGATQ